MANRDGQFSFFQGIHVKIDIRTDACISIRPLSPNLARRYIYKIFDSNETNQGGAGDIITSRSRDKQKYLHYQSAYGHQTWEDGNLPWWAPAYKIRWPFDHLVLGDHLTN